MIKQMVKNFNMPLKIVSCPIIREDDGLAMSSRNIHLSANDKKNALVLSKALAYVKANYSRLDIAELVEHAKKIINKTPGVELDYFTIADGETLLPLQNKEIENPVALVAAKVGETRLIDNILLK